MTRHLKSILLPLLVVIYPVIFLYSYNAGIVEIGSVFIPLLYALIFGAVVFAIFLAFQRRMLAASLSAVIFMIFFFTYGPLYEFLLKLNKVQVEHYTLLPLIVVVALYAAYFSSLIKPKIAAGLQNLLLLVMVVLVGYNLASAVPAEIKKAQLKNASGRVVQAAANVEKKQPDIYFLIFDEYAGFDVVRDYWHASYVNEFEAFLKKKGFFVAENSRSRTGRTVYEMATRLNMTEYDENAKHYDLVAALTNNKVMQVVKSYGYTTVVFNPTFPPPFHADYDIEYDANKMGKVDAGANQFDQMILNNTMFFAISSKYQASDPETVRNRNMVNYTFEQVPNLTYVKSPKFIYAHFLFPHTPFMYNASGGAIDPKNKLNWNYYIGQHQYATQRIQKLIEQILANADPNNPPVIILQSDHGARNLQLPMPESHPLPDYPESNQYHVMNALYLPGFDYSQLKDNMDPLDTFQIVLNHYLNAGVKTDRSIEGK